METRARLMAEQKLHCNGIPKGVKTLIKYKEKVFVQEDNTERIKDSSRTFTQMPPLAIT